MIDKGDKDGVKQGMPVIDALGVIGKIVETSAHLSKVILLTDPQFSVAAIIERTRESGLVSGTLQGLCRLRYLSDDTQIQVGDKVITSKLSGSFPEGLLIGEIVHIEEHPTEPSSEYIVEPVISPSEIEEVLVIVK